MNSFRFYNNGRKYSIFLLVWIIIAICLIILLNAYHSPNTTSVLSSEKEIQKAPKVMTPDWGIAATLTAMGYPPVAMGDKYKYRQWVGKPMMSETTYDVGIRYQPNAEMFSQLDLDMVLDSQFYEHLRPVYDGLNLHSVSLESTKNFAQWEDYVDPVLNIGQYIGHSEAAKKYIKNNKNQITKAGEIFRSRYPKIQKIAVVQFADTNNLRMYSYNSLFEPALSEMGLELVALNYGNKWGFAPITLGDLSDLDQNTCLVVIEPLSELLKFELKDSLVWQRLGYSFDNKDNYGKAERCLTLLPPTWINGGIASMSVFAERLINTNFVGVDEL